MLFYNLDNLLKEANGDSNKLVKSLYDYYLYKNKNLNGYYLPKYSLLGGTSYLTNPKSLFNDTKTLVTHKAQYIILAGKREYGVYAEYGITSLDLTFFPDLNIDKIQTNPLLKIVKNQLNFKYE
jgi:hypothetical protein